MGAWGKEPYANDTAADWFLGAMQDGPLVEQIGTALNSRYEDEMRAAAFLLEKIGYGYVYPHDKREQHIELAITKLQGLLESVWVQDWNEPDGMRAELKRQIDALRVKLNREEEHVLTRKIKEDMGEPKTSVYDALAWCVQQLNNQQYADHAESDLPEELQVARRILDLREQGP